MDEEELYIDEERRDPSEEDIAAALTARITKGKKILDLAEESLLDALRIDGKTLREWGIALTIQMPSCNSENEIREMERASTEIARSIQQVERILAIIDLQHSTSSNSYDEHFARRYVEEMAAHDGRKIAADKLKQLVTVDRTVDATLAASQAAKLASDYFKRQLNGLTEARKGLENRARLTNLRMRFVDGYH